MDGTATRRPFPDAQPPLLVGRAREQARLDEHLTQAVAGQGHLVLIGGEAGMGKTALAQALGCTAVARGALVLMGHCYDLTETPPGFAHPGACARLPAVW